MGEHIQEAGEIDERVTSELLALMDPEYIACDPQPKHLNAIFEQVRGAQGVFTNELRYASPDVALQAGQQFVNHINTYLKKFPKKDRVWGEAATLSGAGVVSSHMNANYFTGDMTTGPSAPSDEAGIFYSQTADIVGKFRGLGFLVRRRDDDESSHATIDHSDSQNEGSYYVRLHYRLATGVSEHAFGKNEMYTLGEIGIANLMFEEDAERAAVHEALTTLLANDSIQIAKLVNKLNRELTNPKHTARHIRKIGHLVQELHANDALRIEDSDAILDLITAYIPPQAAYRIHVTDALEYETDTKSGKISRSLVKATDGAPIEFEQYISNIILSPGYDPEVNLENPQVLNGRGVVPYFVLEMEGSVVHAPMQRVTVFRDVS